MTKLNAIDLELRVRALARTYPDRVYDPGPYFELVDCLYTPDERNPLGCIVGAAAGPLGTDLYEWNVKGAIGCCSEDDGVRTDRRIDGDTEWLSVVQYAQDDGKAWARAVAHADANRAASR